MLSRRTATLTGAAALVVAAVLALLPMSAEGVAGNALRPEYGAFGGFAYGPLPDEPTPADLRAAGDGRRRRRRGPRAARGGTLRRRP